MVPILLERVKEDVPREEGKIPVEDEAEVDEGADGQLGRETDEDVEREVEEAGTYKLEIKFVVGPILK